MSLFSLSPPLLRFFRRQQFYVVIAIFIYAILWATRVAAGTTIDVIVTLIFTLILCNFAVALQELVDALYLKTPLQVWISYLVLLLALSTVAVAIAGIPVFWITRTSGESFRYFYRTGWKFPYVATVIFGISSQIYRSTKTRLEQHNRELQRVVASEAAQRGIQEEELNRALEIQQGLLPRQIPQLPSFEIDGAWEPAKIVGGDYFDFIQLSTMRLAVCIADVVGKSVSAALLMANVQATVRAFASQSNCPADLCSRVNSVLGSNIAEGKFVTMLYGILDAQAKTFEYCNAGHLPPLHISQTGNVNRLEHGGALLGVFPDWKYEAGIVQLAPGDRLLLFTDGITEAAKTDGEEFGEARIIEVVREMSGRATSELKAALLERVKNFCDSHLADDATLIVIAAKP